MAAAPPGCGRAARGESLAPARASGDGGLGGRRREHRGGLYRKRDGGVGGPGAFGRRIGNGGQRGAQLIGGLRPGVRIE